MKNTKIVYAIMLLLCVGLTSAFTGNTLGGGVNVQFSTTATTTGINDNPADVYVVTFSGTNQLNTTYDSDSKHFLTSFLNLLWDQPTTTEPTLGGGSGGGSIDLQCDDLARLYEACLHPIDNNCIQGCEEGKVCNEANWTCVTPTPTTTTQTITDKIETTTTDWWTSAKNTLNNWGDSVLKWLGLSEEAQSLTISEQPTTPLPAAKQKSQQIVGISNKVFWTIVIVVVIGLLLAYFGVLDAVWGVISATITPLVGRVGWLWIPIIIGGLIYAYLRWLK